MNQQRTVIYDQRREILLSDNISDKIEGMIISSVGENFDFYFDGDDKQNYRPAEFAQYYHGILTDGKALEYTDSELENFDKDSERSRFIDKALEIYHCKDAVFAEALGMPDIVREIEKSVLLENVDKAWMEHLEAMDDLKDYVGLNSYAQIDPVAVYRIESADMFDSMSHDIRENTVRKILTVFPTRKPIKRVEVARETGTGASIPAPKKPVVKNPSFKTSKDFPHG